MKWGPSRPILLAALLAGGLIAVPAVAQRPTQPASDANSAEMLTQNFKAEHEIGRRYRIDPAELPAPKTGPIVTNRVLMIPSNGQTLQVPPGFSATPFATGLVNPRRLLVLANGDVLVAEQSAGYLTLLRDDGEGRAKWISRHVEDLNRPYGLAWQNDNLLVADQDGIWRVPHITGAVRRPAISASSRNRRRRSNASTRTAETRRPMPPAFAIRPASPSIPRPAICGASCRSAMGSAITCLRIS
jgi:glucose/arabinose dehydrogenase